MPEVQAGHLVLEGFFQIVSVGLGSAPAAVRAALGGEHPLDQQTHWTARRDGLLRGVGRKVGVELGTGGFQFRAVVEHGAGLAALHVGMKLFGVMGSGGRTHGDKKLCGHFVPRFLFFLYQRPT